MVPVRWKEDPKLGKWVSRQRDSHNEQHVTPERRARLNAIGFIWRASNCKANTDPELASFKRSELAPRQHGEVEDWLLHFGKLFNYKVKHGHTRVPQNYAPDPKLPIWVQAQCCERNRIGPDRRAMLQKIEFDFNQHLPGNQVAASDIVPEEEGDDEETWNHQFFKLVKFRYRHGHILVGRNEQERFTADATLPLLSTLDTDKWKNSKVIVANGKYSKRVGSVEKWKDGYVTVRLPGIGLTYRRPCDLYLDPVIDAALHEWVKKQRDLWNQGCLQAARKKQLQDYRFDLSRDSGSVESDSRYAIGKQKSMTRKGADDDRNAPPAAPHIQGLESKAEKGRLLARKFDRKQSPRRISPSLPTQASLALRAGQNSADPPTGLRPYAVNAVDAPGIDATDRTRISVPSNDTRQQPICAVSPGGTKRSANYSLSAGTMSGDGATGALPKSAADAFMGESMKKEHLARTPPSEQFGMHTTEAIGSNIPRVQTAATSSKLVIPIGDDGVGNHVNGKRHRGTTLATPLRKNATHSDDDPSLFMPTDQSTAMMPGFDSIGGPSRHPGPGQSPAPKDTASASHHVAASGWLQTVTPSPSQEIQAFRRENEELVTPPQLLPQPNPRFHIRKHGGRKRGHADEEERSFAAACRALVEKQLKRLKSQQ
jgi:Helicase associated domain